MSIQDFKTCFELLDYDGNGEIDFSEFCLINTDTTNNVKQYITDIHKNDHKKDLKEQAIA